MTVQTVDEHHTCPPDDLVMHELDTTCVCGPRVVPVFPGTGGAYVLVLHRALDGRVLVIR